MIGLLGRVGQNGVVEREMENQDGKKKKKKRKRIARGRGCSTKNAYGSK